MEKLTFDVSGMTCGGCVRAVTRAVEAVPGVQAVVVDLGAGRVTVDGQPEPQAVRVAIEEAGFDVTPAAG